jgi:ABC-type branched-subunit amino acid transport system ATPase component
VTADRRHDVLRIVPRGDGPEIRVRPGSAVALPDDRALLAGLLGTDRRALARLELAGRRLDRRSLARRVRAGIAVVSDAPVAAELTVLGHLAAAATHATATAELVAAPLLADRGGDPAGILSGGERRVLAWLTARLTAPRAVVLDRAGTGLDADALAWAHATVDGWLDAGVAVVVRVGRVEERRWLTHRADGTPR